MKSQSCLLLSFLVIALQANAQAATIQCSPVTPIDKEVGGLASIEIVDHSQVTAKLQMPATCTGNIITFISTGSVETDFKARSFTQLSSTSYVNQPAQGRSFTQEWEDSKDLGKIILRTKGTTLELEMNVEFDSLYGMVQTLNCDGNIEEALNQ